MRVHQLLGIHPVDVVSAENHHVVRILVPEQVQILVDGIGRAFEPPATEAHLRGDAHHVVVEQRREVPRLGDVPVQAVALVLGEHRDPEVAAVDQIAQREVDQSIVPAERHGGLGPLSGQRNEAVAFATGQDHSENLRALAHGARRHLAPTVLAGQCLASDFGCLPALRRLRAEKVGDPTIRPGAALVGLMFPCFPPTLSRCFCDNDRVGRAANIEPCRFAPRTLRARHRRPFAGPHRLRAPKRRNVELLARQRLQWLLSPNPGKRLYDWVRGSRAGLVVLALAVGAGAGAGAVVFRYLILWCTVLFTGYPDYGGAGGQRHAFLPQIGQWFVILAPVLGGLAYGPLIDRYAREARGHGVPEVMAAVFERGGRIRARVAAIKSLASAICIGAGGSVGREGPIVQIGSALGSAFGQLARLSESRLRLLVACGAAGGISATFNAPIAGVLFSLELILRDFEARAFGVVVLSSVLADIVGRAAFGDRPFLTLPTFELTSLWEYLLYAGLGLVAALVGVAFTRVLYGTEDLIDRVWRGPEWARPAVGGMVLGLILLALPQLYGVGYPVLEQAVRGTYVTWFLLALLVGKILATSVTIGIGGSGGVFAPSLFMGAMLGTAYGQAMHWAFPHVTGPAGAYGLVAMGAVFAGAARAPATAVIIIFELTDEYRIILPLLLAVAVATGVANFISKDSIYTLKLRRRGIDILRPATATLVEELSVSDAMQPAPAALVDQLSLGEVVDSFTREKREALPVVDFGGQYRGTVTSKQVADALRTHGLDVTLGHLEIDTLAVRADQGLEQALAAFSRQEAQELPVLAPDERTVVGWLTHRDVLRAYKERLERDLADLEQGAGANARGLPIARLRGYRILELVVPVDGRPGGAASARCPLARIGTRAVASQRRQKLRADGEDPATKRRPTRSPGQGRRGGCGRQLVREPEVTTGAPALRLRGRPPYRQAGT